MKWPEAQEFTAMRNAVINIATVQKTLVLGLSIQDMNIKTLFLRAKNARAWPWPCAPDSPAYVFCEDKITKGQRDVLNLCYDPAYNDNVDAINEATLIRSWGEQVLIALVLKLLAMKLGRLMELSLTALGKAPIASALMPSLEALRNDIADLAVRDPADHSRTAIVNAAISLWSRLLSLFRAGVLPANPETYEILTTSSFNLIAADPNVLPMGLGRLGIALSLLQQGRTAGNWALSRPVSSDLAAGAMKAKASRAGATERPLFIVKSAAEAITLEEQGAFVNDNAVVIHADDLWRQMVGAAGSRSSTGAPGRTGRVGVTHVSLGSLVNHCADAAVLQEEFVAEMML
jgi:hypothetical protein